MLYQTHHHPFLFHFPPATSSSSTSTLSPPPPLFRFSNSTSPSSIKVAKEMESVEGAGFVRNEMAVDDLWTLNVQNDAFVNELLNFSNEEEEEEEEEEEVNQATKVEEEETTTCEDDKNSDFNTHFSLQDDFCVPADDLASLEWLSHFVDDSNSEYSMLFPAGISPEILKQKQKGTEPKEEPVFFKTPVPGKARSKRKRTGIRVCQFGSTASLTESSSSSSTISSSSSSPLIPWFICTNNYPGGMVKPGPVLVEKPPVKRQKKNPAENMGSSGSQQQPRRCSHCGVQKTPQWRAGPLGAKTLCNACGVRFKSGRLFPEYRPACSPTFSSELHSNHHQKVLEMRRRKEVLGGGQIGPTGLAPQVMPSFF